MALMDSKNLVVVSVGGSLIVPEEIDTAFLTNLKNLIVKELGNGKRFIIITGGGKIARKYQEAAHAVTPLTTEDLDWLGIHSTRLNAHLVRSIFFEYAHPEIFTHPEEVPGDKELVIAAGFRPGSSTDLRAVQIAGKLGASKVVNLSNIDYAYTKDPNKFDDAEPITETTWDEFRTLLPEEWDPGLSAPFDPIAAKTAQELGLEVVIMNGKKLEEFEKYLEGKEFMGTVVK